MPRTTTEDDKKQGDELQSLMDRTGSRSSPGKRSEGAGDDAPTPRQQDDDDDEDEDVEDDDDAGEELQPDDVEDRDSVGR